MLSDRLLPEHIQLHKKLLNKSVSDSEKITFLLSCSILDQNRDTAIIQYILSKGPPAFDFIASKLRGAQSLCHKEVQIVFDDTQPNPPQTIRTETLSERKIQRPLTFESGAMQTYNALVAHHGFKKILSDSQGQLVRFQPQYTSGYSSAYFPLNADLDTEMKVVAKIPYNHTDIINKTLKHEHDVLQKLRSKHVLTVPQLVQEGLQTVGSRNVLLMYAVDHCETDKKALEFLNINDFRNICKTVISTVHAANSEKIFHRCLSVKHLLYDQIGGNVVVTGWAHASIESTDPPSPTILWNSEAFQGKSEGKKQGILLGVMMLDLLGRRSIKAGHDVLKVMEAVKANNLRGIIEYEQSRFNGLVADVSLRIPSDRLHAVSDIIDGLLTERLSLGRAKTLVENGWSEAKPTEWESIDVGPYYDHDLKQMVNPCQIVKKNCVNSKGEAVPGSGVRSAAIELPSGAIAANYGGRQICNEFENRLKDKGLATHVILAQQKTKRYDGRSEGNGIYDHFYYAQLGKVSLNCRYACRLVPEMWLVQVGSLINAPLEVKPGKPVKIEKLIPNCNYYKDKLGSCSVKALASIPPFTEYTSSYGIDGMKMMFGLPQSGIKRLRQETVQKPEGTASAVKKERLRSEEKRSAMRKELKSLGIAGDYEQASYHSLRSASRQLRRRRNSN
jgi:hypothetical protein